jgi:type II secretory pathway pseudopilin PulG
VPVRQRLTRAALGFTLVELLVVISIILFLVIVLVVSVPKIMTRSKIQATQAKLGNLAQALNDYYQSFQAFPPSGGAPTYTYPAAFLGGDEWWRYLSFSGPAFTRPRKADGSIVEEPFIPESKLGLLPDSPGLVRAPKDAFGSDIIYVYPTDNEVANLMACAATGVAPVDSLPVPQLRVAQLYYHCFVLSIGEDKALDPGYVITPAGMENSGRFEDKPKNQDTVQHQLLKTVSGQ